MGGLLQRIKNIFNYKTTTAVLVDTGDVEIQFSVAGLQTRDPIRLAAECRLVVQMENPTQFFENMMKGRQNYPLTEMKAFLEGELRNCLQEFVSTKSVEELSTNLAFKQEMEQGVARHLATTFNRKGLSFVQVRLFDFRHPRMDAVTNKKEEYWLHAQDLQTKLSGEGSTMGLDRKLLDQETAKALMQLEVYEDRAKVFERMRKAVASNQMNQVTSEVELEKFLQGMDKDKLIRDEEMRTLTQDFGEKKDDHDLARAHLIQRLKMEQNTDLKRAEISGKVSLKQTESEAVRAEEMAQLEHEMAARRKEMENRQAQEWAQMKQQVDTKRFQVEAELDLGKKKVDTDLDIDRKKAEADIDLGKKKVESEIDVGRKKMAVEMEARRLEAEARRLEVETDVDLGKKKMDSEIDLGKKQRLSQIELDELEDQKDLRTATGSLDILKKQKGIKKEESDWELDRKLRERAGLSEVAMKEEALRSERELAKIQALGTLSTEALIAAAPADRASMLAELKRTEGLKGFSEDQILAMAAEKSPEIAKAFQEKFRSASTADVQKAYDRMLTMKDEGMKDIKEMSRDYAKMMQEMYNRGMDTQRDTATAAARSAQPGTTVITPGSGILSTSGTGSSGGYGARMVVCPQCHLETEEGHKFCDNCGHKFFGENPDQDT